MLIEEHNDAFFMQLALAEAQRAYAADEVPVGAVIVADGVVVGRGFNQPISSCDPTAHAEMVAMRDAAKRLGNYRLAGATLYVTVEPCTMCFGALVHARVDRIVFAAVEPKAGRLCSHSLLKDPCFNHRPTVVPGVLGEQASQLMQRFFAERRAKKKALKRRAHVDTQSS